MSYQDPSQPPYSQPPQTQPPYSQPPITQPQYPTTPNPASTPAYPQYPAYAPQYAQPPAQYPAQYPAQLPPQPMPPQTVYYQNQSFTGKAVVAFLLYWLGYVPGLIFNIMFLNEARRVQNETGRTPAGYGCLWTTLIVSIVPALLFLMFCFLTVLPAILVGGSQH